MKLGSATRRPCEESSGLAGESLEEEGGRIARDKMECFVRS